MRVHGTFSAAATCETQSPHFIQQLSRLTQQRLNLPSLGDRIPGEQAMLACVPVRFWRPAPLCTAMHTAALPSVHRW
jgi:hypothetical protein